MPLNSLDIVPFGDRRHSESEAKRREGEAGDDDISMKRRSGTEEKLFPAKTTPTSRGTGEGEEAATHNPFQDDNQPIWEMQLPPVASEPNETENGEKKKTSSAERFRSLPGVVVEVRLRKDEKMGFGLALAGPSERERTGTFICGINPGGPAAREGSLRIGDEILKVSMYTLHGR